MYIKLDFDEKNPNRFRGKQVVYRHIEARKPLDSIIMRQDGGMELINDVMVLTSHVVRKGTI